MAFPPGRVSDALCRWHCRQERQVGGRVGTPNRLSFLSDDTRRDLVVVVLLPEQCEKWQPQLKPRLVVQATTAPGELRSELTESLDRKPIRPVDRSWPDLKRCVLATMAIHMPTVGLVRVWYAAMAIASLDARHASNPDFIWTGKSQHRSERSAGAELRFIKGSSSFTDKTWKGNVSNIYGGNSYLKSSAYVTHPSEMPTICTNVFDARPDGEVHDYFICPQAQNPPDFDWCCGMQGREECCQNRRQPSSEQKRNNDVSTKEALMVFFAVFGGHILMALLIYCCVKNGRHRNCSCNCCRKSPPLTQSVRSRVTSSALNPSAVSRRRVLNSLAFRIYTALLTSDRPVDQEDSESSVSDRLEMTVLGDCDVHPSPTAREPEVAQMQLTPAFRRPPPSYYTLQVQTVVMHASKDEPAISNISHLLQQQDEQGECDSPPHYSTLPSAANEDRLSFEENSQSFMEDSQSESENSFQTMPRSFISTDQDVRTGHTDTRALVTDFSHLAQQELHDRGQTQQTGDSHSILGDPPPAYDSDSSM